MAIIQSAHVRLPRVATDLGNQQVNAEGRIGILQMALELVDVVLENLGALAHAANDADAT